jgi:hypothetical protein
MNFAQSVNEMLAGKIVTNKNGWCYRIKNKVLEVTACNKASGSWCDRLFNACYYKDLTEKAGWKIFVPVNHFKDVSVGQTFTRKKDGLKMEKVKVEGASQVFAKTSDGKLFKVEDNEEVTLVPDSF